MEPWEYDILEVKDYPTYFGRRKDIANRYKEVIVRRMHEAALDGNAVKGIRIAEAGMLSLKYPHGDRS
jgi:hypothetical protein